MLWAPVDELPVLVVAKMAADKLQVAPKHAIVAVAMTVLRQQQAVQRRVGSEGTPTQEACPMKNGCLV